MQNRNELLCDCLYFSSNKLSRVVGKIADEEFKITGLSPTYAYLVRILYEYDGITQKEIGEILHITASTTTRFIDKLENKGLLNRKIEGKNSYIYLTDKGRSLQDDIKKAWSNLHQRYAELLTKEEYDQLITMMNSVANRLEGKSN
ncbi:MarR family winged helix-turn-helix transcriptional regulator [Anaeromicropila herbilytica]|uniref:MarR family transcriptional regulator n=1 Tax=Anaeromicropila herbilytica TaxID=2785025 RepID=A0A7R7ENF8_9FIRM|nr:MarR family transcriptional regulator [Anaeromicropila herbilytica]BCN31775.1 MarR family transcriptional regulator [Anaeromicropila herbilytica]